MMSEALSKIRPKELKEHIQKTSEDGQVESLLRLMAENKSDQKNI